MESNSLLMLADVARLDDRQKITSKQSDQDSHPLDGVDHSYLAKNDFELLVNSTHDYYDRVTQAEQETDVDHSYAFFVPNMQTVGKSSDPSTSWYVDPLADTSLVNGIPFPEPLLRCEWNKCSFECEVLEEMKKHMETHLTRGIRTCEWRECSMKEHKYASRCILRRHLLVHLNSKPFQCEDCGKNFRTKERETLHRKAHHLGDEAFRYKCPECDRMFKTTSDRRAHVKMKHLGPAELCGICQERFVTKAVLRRHFQRKHPSLSMDKESNEWKLLHI